METTGLRVPFMMSVFLPVLHLLFIFIHGAVTQPIDPSLQKNSGDISRDKLFSVLSQLYRGGRIDFLNDKIPESFTDTDDAEYNNPLKRAHAGWKIAYGKRYSNKWGMAYGKRRVDDDNVNDFDTDPSIKPMQWASETGNDWKPVYSKRQQGWHIAYGKRSA